MDYKEILAIFDTKGLENDHELCSVFEKAKEAAQAHMRDVHRAREQIRSQLHDAREAGKLTVDGFEHYLPALIPSGTTVDHFEDEGSYIVVRSSPEECLIDMFRSGTCKDWMFVKNREHEYIYANRIMEEDLGLHESGIEGHTDYDFYDESSVGRLESLDQQVIKGNSVSQVHTRDARGQRRTFLDVLVPWRDENGFVIGVLGISRDVTAHYNERVSAGEFQKEDYSSGAMTRVIDQCKNVAKSNSTVLLLGETGAGKNYLARLIHNQSAGRGAPLILVNVTGLPEGLVESELFGYERGGHATAKAAKPGLLELANSGTFVFDEIGDLPLNIQAKLLSFLDSNSFRRLGGTREITVNARMIAATNRDLEKEVLEGRFRQDLFYRLNSIVIQVPPLRERMEDLPRIVSKISKKLREQIPPLHVPPFSASIMEKLKDYSWPGNIRELERLLERVAVLGSVAIDRFLVDISEAPDGSVKANSFQAAEGGSNDRHEEWVWTTAFPRGRKYADVEKELRRALFEEALRRSGGNVQEAARLLGMAREVLSRQLKKMRIDRDQLSQGDKP